MTLGAKLRALRAAKDLSLRQVERETGVAFASISRIERGNKPDIDSLCALAKFYGVSMDSLLFGRELTDEVAEAYLVGLGYNLDELRTEINALIDELRETAKAILAKQVQP